MGLFVLIVIALIGYSIYSRIYNSKDHIDLDSSKLNKDATICDVNTEIVGLKGSHVYRTTVTFSDGYTYISHDTERKERFGYYRITITEEMKNIIVNNAIRAHTNACRGLAGDNNLPSSSVDDETTKASKDSNRQEHQAYPKKDIPKRVYKKSNGKIICPNCNSEQNAYVYQCTECGQKYINGQKGIPYWCGICGKEGPYIDACPKCGSSMKLYNPDK